MLLLRRQWLLPLGTWRCRELHQLRRPKGPVQQGPSPGFPNGKAAEVLRS